MLIPSLIQTVWIEQCKYILNEGTQFGGERGGKTHKWHDKNIVSSNPTVAADPCLFFSFAADPWI